MATRIADLPQPRTYRSVPSYPVHATSTVESGEALTTQAQRVTPSSPRSWARAYHDLRTGLNQRELWSHLGWQDIKQRYRRSVLGPLWITISMGVMAVGLGLLYSQLFGATIAAFLPYITTGFIIWHFIIGCLTEGTDTFIANEGLIKQLPAPLTVYVLRTIWRQVLMFAHNLVVYFVVVAVFWGTLSDSYRIKEGGVLQPGIDFSALLAIPGFLLIAINAGWVVMLFGISSTRFRDIPQVINSITNLLFFMTPIVWSTDILYSRFGSESEAGMLPLVYELNPLYHLVQVVRGPLLGQVVSPNSWLVVIGMAVIGWTAALVVLRNYRSRVSYWV